jgi:hypothetical protein
MNEPATRQDILDGLGWLRDVGAREWSELPPEVFAAPIGDAWSPADNVRHLVKSTNAATKALEMPKLALRTMFGVADKPSRAYATLREDYRQVLAGGANAGKFAPAPAQAPSDPAAWQTELVGTLDRSLAALAGVTAQWEEPALDMYRLPHPLLGKLTVREMLFFTLYHNLHHAGNVKRRLGRAE